MRTLHTPGLGGFLWAVLRVHQGRLEEALLSINRAPKVVSVDPWTDILSKAWSWVLGSVVATQEWKVARHTGSGALKVSSTIWREFPLPASLVLPLALPTSSLVIRSNEGRNLQEPGSLFLTWVQGGGLRRAVWG